MKKIKYLNTKIFTIILIICLLAVFNSCSSSKENAKTANNNTKTTSTKNYKENKKGFQPIQSDEQRKEREKQIKEQVAKNKELEKQAKAKKKKEEKENKQKQKEQEKLIQDAAKNEKKRIEAEREKEKEELRNSLKNFDTDNENAGDYAYNTEEDKNITNLQYNNEEEISKILQTDSTQMQEIVLDEKEEDSNSPEFIKKVKDKAQQIENITSKQDEHKINMDSLAPMDKILYMTETNNGKNIKQEETDKKKNVIQRTWHEMFPEHIDREIPYDNLYKEKPKTIMILYPWNRSDYKDASDMLLIAATKELTSKGYYVTSMIAAKEMYKKDSLFCSHYTKLHNLKKIGEQYGIDAVMVVTVYRFDKPYWSTATKANIHYTLISTKTLDTLFLRSIEFDYDTPIAPKENKDLSLDLNEQQRYDLGVMQQLNAYALRDFPKGPYHKKYNSDRKKFSNKKEVKYKVNVRPS